MSWTYWFVSSVNRPIFADSAALMRMLTSISESRSPTILLKSAAVYCLEKSNTTTLVFGAFPVVVLIFWMSRAVASSFSSVSAIRTMLNPQPARCLALARPIPSVAPVITAQES